jgi:NAD(P)-dependent dehydrogenase (short-subunit alcohol dehydrogenase family)
MLEGTFAVVVGGSSGIGLGAAAALARAGAKVAITGRSADKAQAAAASIGPNVVTHAVDAKDLGAMQDEGGRSRPLVSALQAWLREQRSKLSASNEVPKAIQYSLSRWTALTRFLDDGRLCMSNNAAEPALHSIAVGRHNWTFAGSDDPCQQTPRRGLVRS